MVGHLEELRARLIISLAALAVAFGFCMWQNHALLTIINKPLAHQTQKQVRSGHGPLGATYTVQQGARVVATQLEVVVGALGRPGSGASAAVRKSLAGVGPALDKAIAGLSRPPEGDKPVTLGIGEPFSTTIGVALIFAFILALPVILYELYAFLIPAFSPEQQRVANSLVLAVPLLFVTGVAFGYFVVLPAAVRFFQNFNSGQFNVLVQASQYYHFVAVILLAMGLVFQVPVAILAATRSGVVTPASCARTAVTRSWPAARLRRSCQGTRSRCCWRRSRCTCSSRRACCWRPSLSVASSVDYARPADRRAGKRSNGETQVRTGDTTIFVGEPLPRP